MEGAVDRYVGEIKRVSGVLEAHLAKQKAEHGGKDGFDGPWLVGNKMSFVDFAFVPWQASIPFILPAGEYDYDVDEFPTVKEWLAKLEARESVKKAMAAMR